MDLPLIFSGSKVIGKMILGFTQNRNQNLLPNEPMNAKLKINLLILIVLQLFTMINCNVVPSSAEDSAKKENSLLKSVVLYQTSQINQMGFELNGTYLSYFGTSTSTTTKTYISAIKGKSGLWLDDTGNGDTTFTNQTEYSNCYLIEKWDSTSKYLITHNPPNNGSCYAENTGYIYGWGSNSNNTYNKIYWSYSGSNIYYCTTAYGKTTLASAENDTQIADTTKYDTTGCAGSSWNRLVKVE